jgi:hypothetical protein
VRSDPPSGFSNFNVASDDDDGTYALAVAEAVIENASKSREQWRLELEESDESAESDRQSVQDHPQDMTRGIATQSTRASWRSRMKPGWLKLIKRG